MIYLAYGKDVFIKLIGGCMYISEIKGISNYRNLSNVDFSFDKKINFVVGENNIGKTNLIELMSKLIKVGKFEENDFTDIREPIEVTFKIGYSIEEIGFFENTFDIDDTYAITITARQENIDDRIEYCHTASGSNINLKNIKMLNFIYYSSLRSPNKELSFSNNIGTGKVLKYIMKKSLESKDIEQMDLLKQDDVNEVILEVNSKFDKLNGLSSEKIEAFLSNDNESIINRLLEIGDSNGRNISELGDGLQYSFNIFLNILELLVNLKTTKKDEDFESLLIKCDEGYRYLPIILGLDEPEVHQHPFRQRALIKSIQSILDGHNEAFTEIIQELFDIDGFYGQVFISTHSPNIILNDYRQITRIYKSGANIGATSGNSLIFEPDIHKHLMRSFVYFKEAMFARSVILVEGDTEYGAIPIFADRLKYDLDEKNVGVVKLDGADGVLKYLKLFDAYKIDAVAILDKDKESDYTGNPKIKFTSGEDFEEELFDNYTFKKYIRYLVSVRKCSFLVSILKSKIEGFQASDFMKNPTKYNITEETGVNVMMEIRDREINELRNLKNAINGALLAKYVDIVPQSFEDVINYAICGLYDK